MTQREKFCRVMERRGYTVTSLGLITFLDAETEDGGHYSAMWFFNPDGTRNESQRATWKVTRPQK
jgi:hypothetical protein